MATGRLRLPMDQFQTGVQMGQMPGANPTADAIKSVVQRYQTLRAQKEEIAGQVSLHKQKIGAESEIQEQQITGAMKKYGADKYEVGLGKGGKMELKEKPKPTWSQSQNIDAIKSGLKRGNVVIGKQFGEPSEYPIKSVEDAYKAIEESGLSPSQFTEELKQYEEVPVIDARGNPGTVPRNQLQEALRAGYTEVK